jgi:polyisoprenoid-binding protein YceI
MTQGPIRRRLLIVLSVALLASAVQLQAQDVTVELDPARSKIDFTLSASMHTVHGTFQFKSGTIHFNPATGMASGIIIADATSADTGNKSRDHKMHTEVLKSAQYPQVTFTPTKISGATLQADSTVQLEGVFRLSGSDHPMSMSAPVHFSGDSVTVTTHFVVPYVAWGLKNPSTFLLHVSDKVQVDVTATGHISK